MVQYLTGRDVSFLKDTKSMEYLYYTKSIWNFNLIKLSIDLRRQWNCQRVYKEVFMH
jgi:hypothetical protein